MPDVAGRITVRLDYQAGQIRDLKLSSSRPKYICQLFNNRSVEQALGLVPMLFSLCSTAQTLAMVRGVEQAQGIVTDSATELARDLLLALENARELLFRLCRSWSVEPQQVLPVVQQWQQFCNQANSQWRYILQPGAVACDGLQALSAEAAGLLQALSEPLLGMPLSRLHGWLDQALPDAEPCSPLLEPMVRIQQRFAGLDTIQGITALPDLQEPRNQQLLDGVYSDPSLEEFSAQPCWQGCCCETGSYVAQADNLSVMLSRGWHPAALRYAALLLELSQMPERIRTAATEQFVRVGALSGPGTGFGVVNTSRGQLLHRVRLEGKLIRQYAIVAPTEWNLHPQGLIRQTLKGVNVEDSAGALELCRMMVLLADPCVPFDLELEETEHA